MIPFIRSGEVVELEPVVFSDVKPGEVLLARRSDGAYVLHRVARLGDGRLFMVSDAGRADGWIEAEDIVARAVSVLRKGRVRSLNSPHARRLGLLWMRLGFVGTRSLGLYLAIRRRTRPGGRAQGCDQNTA
jgi:hypothetical protein